MIRRIAAEGAALLGLALACAWASNALAGPERRLSWFPRQVRAVQATPGQAAPGQAAPVQSAPGQSAPVQATPGQSAPVQATPGQAAPVQAAPVQATPGQAAPVQAAPVQAAPKARAAAASPDPIEEMKRRFPPLTDAPMADIGGEDALWLHGRGALFVDARRTSLWAQGHIRGAQVISVWEDGLAEKVERLAMFTPDLKRPVVLYCTGGDCRDSHLLGQKLWLAGFRNIRIYTGGYPDWEARRGPVALGETP